MNDHRVRGTGRHYGEPIDYGPTAKVRVSVRFDCGCSLRPDPEPIGAMHVIGAGVVRDCPKHGPQTVTRVTQHLAEVT